MSRPPTPAAVACAGYDVRPGPHRRYLSVVEYAELTGRKPDTIRKQCLRGTLKTRAKRPGRHWAILATQAKP